MDNKEWFGNWLPTPTICWGIRLVIEQMNEQADTTGLASLFVETEPASVPFSTVVSSGTSRFPWYAEKGDEQPSAGVLFRHPVTVKSFRCLPLSTAVWVRRARIEICHGDSAQWQTLIPTCFVDAYHRQPCVFGCDIEKLESSFLPCGQGKEWIKNLFHDFFLRTIEYCGPGSSYPDGLTARYLIGSSAWPSYFHGVWNPGDSGSFNPLISAILQPLFTTENQKLFPELMRRFGFMPGVMEQKKTAEAFMSDYSSNIWGPSCYWDLWSWTRDHKFLSQFTPAIAQWTRWFLTQRDPDHDGWIETGVNSLRKATAEERGKLLEQKRGVHFVPEWFAESVKYVGVQRFFPAMQLAFFETPWDDWPVYARGRCRGIRFDAVTHIMTNIHFIETQLYNADMAAFCAKSFERIGDRRQAEEFRHYAFRLDALVRDNCWDEASGFYYDQDAETGRLRLTVKSAGGFYPMLRGLPTRAQAQRMVEHLLNPKEFWTEYPVPTLSQDCVDYKATNYWSGRAWPPVNFHILRGLIRYGFFNVADQLLERWMKITRKCFDRPREGRFNYTLAAVGNEKTDMSRVHISDCEIVSPENWNPETGTLMGSPGVTWGGLWLPSLIYRNFWPDGEHYALVRPGGFLRFQHKKHWNVCVDDRRAEVNGYRFEMRESKTHRLDLRNGRVTLIESPYEEIP